MSPVNPIPRNKIYCAIVTNFSVTIYHQTKEISKKNK